MLLYLKRRLLFSIKHTCLIFNLGGRVPAIRRVFFGGGLIAEVAKGKVVPTGATHPRDF
jgi:hypothetical protein